MILESVARIGATFRPGVKRSSSASRIWEHLRCVLVVLVLSLCWGAALGGVPIEQLIDELKRREAAEAELFFDYELAKRLQAELSDQVRQGHPDVLRDPDGFQKQLDVTRQKVRELRLEYLDGQEQRERRLVELRNEVGARSRALPESSLAAAVAIAANVRSLYMSANLKPDMPAMEKAQVHMEGAKVMRTAEALAQRLQSGPPVTDAERGRYVRDLVHLASLACGQKEPICTATYNPVLKGSDGNTLYGQWSPWNGIQISGDCLKSMGGSFHFSFLTAAHEVVHALDFKRFEAAELRDLRDSEERLRRTSLWMERRAANLPFVRNDTSKLSLSSRDVATLRTLFGVARNEIRTENRAALIAKSVVVHPDVRAFQASKEYREHYKAEIRDGYSIVRAVVMRENDSRYRSKLEESRRRLGWSGNDRVGDFQRTLDGAPIFGGVILGARLQSMGWKCEDLRFVAEGDHSLIRLRLRGVTGSIEVEWDPGSDDALWCAYQIVRPDEDIRRLAGLKGQESSLVTCEGRDWEGIEAAMHPAVRMSKVGLHMMGLEMAALALLSGRGSLNEPESDPMIAAVQWHDRPMRLMAGNGLLRVINAEEPEASVLTVRVPAVDWSRVRNDKRGYLVSVAGTLFEAARTQMETLTPRQFDQMMQKQVVVGEATWFTNVNHVFDGKLSTLLPQSGDWQQVERFARTLALVTWASEELGSRFPRLPEQVLPLGGSVPVRWDLGQMQGYLGGVQHSEEVRRLLEPMSREEGTGDSRWYKILEDGFQVGALRVRREALLTGAGGHGEKRVWDSCFLHHTLGQVTADHEHGELVFDASGKLVASELSLRMGENTNSVRMAAGRVGGSLGGQAEGLGRTGTSVLAQEWPYVVDKSFLMLGGGGRGMPEGGRDHFDAVFFRKDLFLSGQSSPVKRVEAVRLKKSDRVFSYRFEGCEVLIEWGAGEVPEKVMVPGHLLSFVACTREQALAMDATLLASDVLRVPVDGVANSLSHGYQIRIQLRAGSGRLELPTSEWTVQASKPTEIVLETSCSLLPGHFPVTEAELAQKDGFRRSSYYINSEHPRIRELVEKVVGDSEKTDQWKVCDTLERHVSQLIQTDFGQPLTSASGVLESPIGDCKHSAVLLCALIRAAGIPARVVGGLGIALGGNSAVGHAWVEAMMGGYWYRFDSAVEKGSMIYIGVHVLRGERGDIAGFESLHALESARLLDQGEMSSPLLWVGERPVPESIPVLSAIGFGLGYYRSRAHVLQMFSDADLSELAAGVELEGLKEKIQGILAERRRFEDVWESRIQGGVAKMASRHLDSGVAEGPWFRVLADACGYSLEARRAQAVDLRVGAAFSLPALLEFAGAPVIQEDPRLRGMIMKRFEAVIGDVHLEDLSAEDLRRAFEDTMEGRKPEGEDPSEPVDRFVRALGNMLPRGRQPAREMGPSVGP